VVDFDRADGIRDEGIVPLADFVDRDGGDACAVAVEYNADGTVIPVVYVREAGRLVEHSLPPPHPLHARSIPTGIVSSSRRVWAPPLPRRAKRVEGLNKNPELVSSNLVR
jgi:hypothetical protein